MKKRIALYIISLTVVVLLSACSSQKVADPIVFPETGDLAYSLLLEVECSCLSRIACSSPHFFSSCKAGINF